MSAGIFAGGFMQGFAGGLNMGKTLKGMKREKEVEDIRAQGIMEAKNAREADIAGQINDTGAQAAKAPDAKVTTDKPETSPSPAPAAPVASTSPVETPNVEERPQASAPTPGAQASQPTPAAQGLGATPQAQTSQITPQAASVETPARPFAAGIENPVITPQAQEQPQAQPQAQSPAAQGMLGRYVVGNQRYGTPEQARAAAEKNVGTAQDYILKNVVPKLQEKYIQYGDLESAQKLGDYMESRRGKEATNIFGKAMTAMMTGDTESGVKHFGEYYNKFIDDGIDFKSHTIGQDGNINFKVARKSDGKEFDMSLSRGELLRLGMAHDPARMYATLMDAEKTKQQQAGEIAKEDRAFKRDIYKDDRNHNQAKELKTIDQNNAIEKMTIEKQLEAANASTKVKREVNAKIGFLRDAGYSDQFINETLPQIIGIGDFKKRTSPEEARRLAFSDRMKSDPMFGRKSAEDQNKILDQDMKLIYGGLDPKATPVAPSAPASPAAAGLPQPAAKKAIPVYDTKTGGIVYR